MELYALKHLVPRFRQSAVRIGILFGNAHMTMSACVLKGFHGSRLPGDGHRSLAFKVDDVFNVGGFCGNFKRHISVGKSNNQTESTGILSETQYESICEETLESLADYFDDVFTLHSSDPDIDVSLSNGVLTVHMGKLGTYVINKQTPNKQIWLSSPFSGPKRYDFVNGRWIYKHNGICLHDLLTEEISKAIDKSVDFRNCLYGKMTEQK